MRDSHHERHLSFTEHLEEVRKRALFILIILFIFSGLSYAFLDIILKFIIRPVGHLVFLKPAEAFVTRIKVAVFCGFFLSIPFVLHQIWKFFLPGLYSREIKYLRILFIGGYGLFLVGCWVAFQIILPFTVAFLLSCGEGEGLKASISFASYTSFIFYFVLALGSVFELPVILFFLTRVGLVSPDFFAGKRRYALVISFILAAPITPPDGISQVMVALPLWLLYEVSVWLSRLGKNIFNHESLSAAKPQPNFRDFFRRLINNENTQKARKEESQK